MLGQYGEAIDYFNNVIYGTNSDLPYFYNLHLIGKGISLFNLKDYEKALNYFNRAIEVGDNNACGFYWKSIVLKKLGDIE